MEEWKTYKIGEICESISDTYKGKAPNVVLVNTSDVYDGVCLNHTYVPNKDLKGQFKKTFKRNDILYSEIRPANRRFAFVDFAPENYIASTKLMVIRCSKLVRPRYLYHYLKRQEMLDELQALAESRSGTFPQITFSELALFEISLPSLTTQDKIVAAIDCFDDKIALNTRINHNLEEQAQALYKSWFVDFEPFKGGKFVDSELGMIPEGWHVGTLSELVEVRYGKDHKMLNDGRIPVYGSGGLMRYADRALLKSESVLIPRKGTLNNVMYVSHPFWTVDTMFYTIGKTKHVIKYAHLFLLTQDLASMNAGSAVPSMTTDILNKLPVLIPTCEVLRDFDAIVSALYLEIGRDRAENASLASSRDSILPKLMSGAIDFNMLNC